METQTVMFFIVCCGMPYGNPGCRWARWHSRGQRGLRQPAEPDWAEGRRQRSAGLRFKLQKVPILIERLRQSGYAIQAELRQPVRGAGFFGMLWQRITGALRFLGG